MGILNRPIVASPTLSDPLTSTTAKLASDHQTVTPTVSTARPINEYASGPRASRSLYVFDYGSQGRFVPPSPNPSAQVEALIVNIIGVVMGLGWSNLGLACAAFATRRYGVDSNASRAIRACFLITIGFLAGFIRSRMSRLTLASRAVSLIGIWLIARAPETVEWDYRNFTELFFAFSIAGAASLVVSLTARAFIHPGGYAKDVIDALGTLKDLIQPPSSQTLPGGEKPISGAEVLHAKSLDRALALHASYAYSAYELRIGRVPIKAIKPLLITVNRIREELAWGEVSDLDGMEILLGEPTALSKLNESCRACSSAIDGGIFTLQAAVGKCFGIKLPNNAHKTTHLGDPLTARASIASTSEVLKVALDSVVHEINKTCNLRHDERHHKVLFQKCLHSTSLIQISSELIRALTLAHGILTIHHDTPRPHIFFPRPSLFWLGMSPRSIYSEEEFPASHRSTIEPDTDLVGGEMSFDEMRVALLPTPIIATPAQKWSVSRLIHTPAALRARIRLSGWLREAKHSQDVQFAFKHALGIAILMIPALLPESSGGRRYYDSNYGVWAIVSFVYVIEPNTALTWRMGVWRVFGTTLGALYAFITWHVAGTNPYGVVVLVTVAEIFITWFVRSSNPGVGIVASVTIPPVLFIPYSNIGDISISHLTALRALQISIGIIVAILIDQTLFPKHVRAIFLGGMAKIMEEIQELHSGLSRATFPPGSKLAHKNPSRAKLERRIQKLLKREKINLIQMEHELSLMPKPTASYRVVTDYTQRLLDLVVGLRRIRDTMPRVVIDPVLIHRKQMDSCISLVLYACEHTFRSRRALPQVLPTPRKALENLNAKAMDTLQSQIRGMGIVYAIAEREMVEELVGVVEGLVHVTRDLFGTRTSINGVDDARLRSGL